MTDGGGAARVTSDPTFAVGAGITTITSTTAAAILVTDREGTNPRGEGRTTTTLLSSSLIATCCKVGLHSSRTGGGAMLNPDSIWPLSKNIGHSHSKKLNSEIEKIEHTRMQAAGL